MIFERLGIDVVEVIEGASTKWNFNVYHPGAGVGGHCLPVDPYYLVKKAKELGYHSRVIAAGRSINDHMPRHMLNLIQDALNNHEKSLKNSRIVVLGYSYKENVGDPRESPARTLVEYLQDKEANITVVDPYLETIDNDSVILNNDIYQALEGADAMVLITAHDDFKKLDFEKIKEIMNLPLVVDGRRIYDQDSLKKLGFYYQGVGFSQP